MEQEEPMNLPNDIRLKIEKSPDKEDILLFVRPARHAAFCAGGRHASRGGCAFEP